MADYFGTRKLVTRPIADLIPFARNSRTHSDAQVAQIAASIKEFGWTNPILIGEDGGIIAGHGRLLAARQLGSETVPCIVLDGLTDAQKRALVIADNKLALNAGWDVDLLSSEIAGLGEDGFDLTLLGFDKDELADLLVDKTEGLTDPDAAPALPDEPVSRLGDVWILGRHRIVCGDSTDADVVTRCLNGAKPRLMVTDPPYGVEYDPEWRQKAGVGGSGSATGKVLNDDRADWREAWALFPGSVAYVWHGGLHSVTVARSLAVAGLLPRAQIVWVKTRSVLSRGNYHWQHEPAFYASKEGEEDGWQDRFEEEHETAAYAVRKGDTAKWRGGRKQTTVWFIEHLKSDTGHGTQKPVECMKRPIENNSAPGEAVYEPFSGSGTTIIAGEMSGRCIHAIELNPAYVDVAVQRWSDFTGKDAVLEATGDTFSVLKAGKPATKEAA